MKMHKNSFKSIPQAKLAPSDTLKRAA